MELNLRPARVVRRHQLAEKRPYLIVGALCSFLALTAWWLYLLQGATKLDAATHALEPKVSQLQHFEGLIKKAQADIRAEQDTAAPFLAAVDEKSYWIQIIDDINSRLPKEDVWVVNFDVEVPKTPEGGGGGGPGSRRPLQGTATSPKNGARLILKGLYLSNPRQAQVVDDFVAKLKESTLYSVDTAGIKRSVPNDQDWAFDFTIPLVLNNPISGLVNSAK